MTRSVNFVNREKVTNNSSVKLSDKKFIPGILSKSISLPKEKKHSKLLRDCF